MGSGPLTPHAVAERYNVREGTKSECQRPKGEPRLVRYVFSSYNFDKFVQ